MTQHVPRRALVEEPTGPRHAFRDGVDAAAPAASLSASPDPGTAPAEGGGYLSHKQILVVMGGLMAGMFLAALD